MRRAAGVARPVLTPMQRREATARRRLASLGYDECVTYSFIDRAAAALFGGGGEAVRLENPISSEMSHLRPDLLPGLLRAAARNQARGSGDLALFELGQVFPGGEPGEQAPRVAGLRVGASAAAQRPRHPAAGRPLGRARRRRGGARRPRRAGGPDDPPRRARLVPSRALRRARPRAEDAARRLRRGAPSGARGPRRQGPGGRLQPRPRRPALPAGRSSPPARRSRSPTCRPSSATSPSCSTTASRRPRCCAPPAPPTRR